VYDAGTTGSAAAVLVGGLLDGLLDGLVGEPAGPLLAGRALPDPISGAGSPAILVGAAAQPVNDRTTRKAASGAVGAARPVATEHHLPPRLSPSRQVSQPSYPRWLRHPDRHRVADTGPGMALSARRAAAM
jgi:hypothetical protein